MKTSSGKPVDNLVIYEYANKQNNFYYICNTKIIELFYRLRINFNKYIEYDQTENKTNNKRN